MNNHLLTDTHAHIHMADTFADPAAVIKRAKDAGVGRIITIGTNYSDSLSALKLADDNDNIYAAAGVHPQDVSSYADNDYSAFRDLASSHKVIAIGEIGLDFYRDLSQTDRQDEVFRQMLRLSIEARKPVIIHNRNAGDDCIRTLKEELGGCPHGGVFHCFDGDMRVLDFALQNNFYVSYAGQVTYKSAGNIRDALVATPLERLLIETDSPYLAPVPMRGNINEPANIIHTANFIANILNIDIIELGQILENNFKNLFFKGLL